MSTLPRLAPEKSIYILERMFTSMCQAADDIDVQLDGLNTTQLYIQSLNLLVEHGRINVDGLRILLAAYVEILAERDKIPYN